MTHGLSNPMQALELINSHSPAVGYIGQIAPTISLEGDHFDEASASSVIHHALQVHQFELAIRTSARLLCVAMYHCHEAYIAASTGTNCNGWQDFCARNFARLRMSDGNIRAAVRTGSALVNHEKQYPEGIEFFDQMSRAALFAIGGNEQTLIAVQEVLQADPAGKITAEDVRRIAAELSSETIARLEAEKKLSAVEQTNVELCERLEERKTQAMRWKGIAEQAQIDAKTPVEAIKYALPKGVASEVELKETLTKENSELKDENERILSRLKQEGEKLQSLQRTLSLTEQSKVALDDLQADVSMMLAKYPKALAERMASVAPAIKEQFKAIAADLRSLAVALDVE